MLKSRSATAEWSVVIPKLPASVQNAVAEKLSSHFGLSSEEARETLQNTPIILLDSLRLSDAEKIKELFAGTAEHLMLSRDASFKKKCFRVLWSKAPAELLSQWLPPEPAMPAAPAAVHFEQEPEPVQENQPEAFTQSELAAEPPRGEELEARVKAHEARGAELNELIDKQDRNLRSRELALDKERERHVETQRLLSETRQELEKWVQKEKQARVVLRQFEGEIEKAAEGVQGAVREAEEWKEKVQKLEMRIRELETAESEAKGLMEGKRLEFESDRKARDASVTKLEAKINALESERGKEKSRSDAVRDQLESQLARARSEKDSLSREMEGVRRKMAEFDKARQKAEREMAAALEEKKAALREAAEFRKKRQESEKNRELVQHLQAQNEQAAAEMQELQSALRKKEETLKLGTGQLEKMHIRESELLQEAESLRRSLAEAGTKTRLLESKIQDLESLGAASREILAEWEHKYTGLETIRAEEKARFEAELGRSADELLRVREESQTFLAQGREHEQRAGQLQAELQNLNGALAQAQRELDQSHEQLNAAVETLQIREQDLQATREALRVAEETIRGRDQDLESARAEREAFQQQVTELQARCEQDAAQLGDWEKKCASLTVEYRDEQARLEEGLSRLSAELELAREESLRQIEQTLAGEREKQQRDAQKFMQERESLQRELETVRAECETVRIQWAELEGKRAAYVSLIAEWESRSTILELRLQEDKQQFERDLAQTAQELQEARAHLDQRNQAMTMMGQTIESREVELGLMREKITGLEERCSAYELKIAAAESKWAALEAEHHEEKRQIQEALGKLADDLKQAQEDTQVWKTRTDEETQKAGLFQAQSEAHQEAVEKINAELECARQESAQARDSLEAIQRELRSICAEQESLKEKLANSEQNRGAYETALADLGRKQEALQSLLAAERKQAGETICRMAEEAERSHEALSGIRQELERKTGEWESARVELHSRLRQFEEISQQLKQSLEISEKELADRAEQSGHLREAAEKFQAQVHSLEAASAQARRELEDLTAERAAERQAGESEKEGLVKAAKDAKEELRNFSHRFQALEEVKNEFVALLAAERRRYSDMKAEYDRLQNRLEYQILESPQDRQPSPVAAFEPEETDDARLKRLKLILDMEDKKEKTPPGFAG